MSAWSSEVLTSCEGLATNSEGRYTQTTCQVVPPITSHRHPAEIARASLRAVTLAGNLVVTSIACVVMFTFHRRCRSVKRQITLDWRSIFLSRGAAVQLAITMEYLSKHRR
ncbi:Protein of unknown function [Gryllus bimaculatus]|nr:Protein of unknown function [Gryllus bimaculatus]